MSSKPANPITKRRQRPFSLTEKTMIYNMFCTLRHEATSDTSNNDILKTVASSMGIHWVSVHKVVKEKNIMGVLRSPKTDKPRLTVIDKTDSSTKNALRDIIQEFHRRKEIPTLNKILKAVNNDGTLGSFKRTSLYKLLRNIGFQKSGKQEQATTLENQKICKARSGVYIHIKTEPEDPLSLPETSYKSEILDIKIDYEETEPISFKTEPSDTESDITNDSSGNNVLNLEECNDGKEKEINTEILPKMIRSTVEIIKTELSETESDIDNASSVHNVLDSVEWNDSKDKEGNTEFLSKMAKPKKRRAISSASTSKRRKRLRR